MNAAILEGKCTNKEKKKERKKERLKDWKKEKRQYWLKVKENVNTKFPLFSDLPMVASNTGQLWLEE